MKKVIKGGDHNQLFHFKRWSRKPWGAFASLRRLKIGVLSVGMGMIAFGPKSASAQSDTLSAARTVEMEAMSVTAEKMNPTRGVVTPVAVYGRDSVGAMPLQTIESVLRLDPAIDLRERSSKGAQADISLRGGTYDQTMVLLNGIDFTDARTGHQSHSIPVDLGVVSSIDLLSGLSGIGAYAGALNFSTTPLRPKYLRAEITGGQYGYAYGNLSGAISNEGLSVMGAGSYRRSDGYIQNTDFNTLNLFARANYHCAAVGLLDVQGGYQTRGFGANSFYSFKYPNQYEHTRTALGSVRWCRDVGAWTLSSHVSYRRNWDRFELYRDAEGAPDGWVPNFHATDNVGAEVSAEYRWRAGKSAMGVDYTYNHIYSNVMGEELSRPREIGGEDGIYYTKAKGRHIVNGWLGHSVQLRTGTGITGSVGVADSPYGTFPSWSLSVKQRISSAWSLDINSTRSMRLPTFTDLYYSTSETHDANAALKPEHAYTTQIGVRFNKGRWSASAVGYHRLGIDVIDWVREPVEGSKWQARPIEELNTLGCEVSLGYGAGEGFLRTLSVSYGYINTKEPEKKDDYISRYALDFLRNKVVCRGGVHIWQGIMLDVTASWYDRAGTYEVIAGEKLRYEPFWLVDARLSWRKGLFTVYADVTNMLNKRYWDFGGIAQAPGWVTGGIVVLL